MKVYIYPVHQIIYITYVQFLYINYTSIKLQKIICLCRYKGLEEYATKYKSE